VILALTDANPIEVHANGLGSFLLDVVIGNASGSGVIHLQIGVAGWGYLSLSESNAQGTCMFGIGK